LPMISIIPLIVVFSYTKRPRGARSSSPLTPFRCLRKKVSPIVDKGQLIVAQATREGYRVLLTVGNKVVYPSQGPCLIGPVVKKVVDGRPMSFYRLAFLDDSGGELFVPVDKAQALGVRRLLERSEIPKLLGHLKKAAGTAKNWKQRTIDNIKLLASGSAFDLAEIVESLTALSKTKSLLVRDSLMLERARKLLVCEISEVMGETKSAAEEQIDRALNGG
jgi:CarD family transcriptional regulator